jgi:hypothetical protein
LSFLKNYTSTIPVSQTIARIESVLIRCGVSGIMKEYAPFPHQPGVVSAITFRIQTSDNIPAMAVRLPVDTEQAVDALWKDYANGEVISPDGYSLADTFSRKRKRKKDFIQQAERTAWKIIQDWVEVQMSMIQMQQADFREVFLPYIWDGQQTVYQRIQANGYTALLTGKNEP